MKRLVLELRKWFAEWLAETALKVYPSCKEKDSLQRCLYAHACYVSAHIKNEK